MTPQQVLPEVFSRYIDAGPNWIRGIIDRHFLLSPAPASFAITTDAAFGLVRLWMTEESYHRVEAIMSGMGVHEVYT